jgi:hypothetical protein
MKEKLVKMNGYLEAMAYFNSRPNHSYTFEFIEFDRDKLNEPSSLKYLFDWRNELRKELLNWFFEVCEEYDMPEIPLKFQKPCVNRFIELIEDFFGNNSFGVYRKIYGPVLSSEFGYEEFIFMTMNESYVLSYSVTD